MSLKAAVRRFNEAWELWQEEPGWDNPKWDDVIVAYREICDVAEQAQAIKHITVVSDLESGQEALYVEGQLETCADDIYTCDIVQAAKGSMIMLEHRATELTSNAWPKLLSELPSAEIEDA